MRISHIFYDYSSFVRQDNEILSKIGEVERINYRSPVDILKMAASISKSDVSFSWFASGHAFIAVLLSKLLRKKSVVVAGGFDVACVPEENYGIYCGSKLKRFMTSFALRNADKVLAVSHFVELEASIGLDEPKPHPNFKVVYNAVDINRFKPSGEKENLVLTVGSKVRTKRMDIFIHTARLLSSVRFVIVGLSDSDITKLTENKPDNVELYGFRDPLPFFQKAKVYCQLSFIESFGLALAEAMACECVPVVTARGAMPEVVADTGVYVKYESPKDTARGILEALELEGSVARQRIVNNFSLERRERIFSELFGEDAL